MMQQKQIEADDPKTPFPSKESLGAVSAALADEAHLAKNIIETVREPLLVLDGGLHVQLANGAFYRMFQVTQEEVKQQFLYEIGNGQWDIPLLRLSLEDILTHDTPFEDLEVEHEFSRIGRKIMLLNGRRIVREADATPLILLAIEDISERRHAERLLQIHVQKLEWSNRELQDFAYIASHDLQEPLRAIQAFGERLRTRGVDDLHEEARDYLDRMLRAASRMRVLIHDLLEFSRVTTKARPFAPVDLTSVAQQALADLATRCEETQGRVEVGSLPTLDADATQMRQLLQNLIDNGLKYGRDDVPPVVIVSSEILREKDALRPEGRDMCRIAVQDNGIGFEEKYAERIFAPFQRLHSRGRYDGTGIGLAICRKIVERHDGRIQAQSVPGEGSLFIVMLPIQQSEGE